MAELALVLMMIFIGSQTPHLPSTAGTPSSSVQPTVIPQPTGTGGAPGLIREGYKTAVRMASMGDRDAARKLAAKIAEEGQGKRVGMILLFGVSFSADPAAGEVVSEAMKGMLLADPTLAGNPPIIDCYHQIRGPEYPRGLIMAKVFYYAA